MTTKSKYEIRNEVTNNEWEPIDAVLFPEHVKEVLDNYHNVTVSINGTDYRKSPAPPSLLERANALLNDWVALTDDYDDLVIALLSRDPNSADWEARKELAHRFINLESEITE